MNALAAFTKLSQLPKDLQQEVMDFIEFLLNKKQKNEKPNKPVFGSGKGMFNMKHDFDEPLEEF